MTKLEINKHCSIGSLCIVILAVLFFVIPHAMTLSGLLSSLAMAVVFVASLCVLLLVASSFLQRDGNIQRGDDPPERYDLPAWQEYNRLYDHMEQQGTGYTDEMRAASACDLEAAKKLQECVHRVVQSSKLRSEAPYVL